MVVFVHNDNKGHQAVKNMQPSYSDHSHHQVVGIVDHRFTISHQDEGQHQRQIISICQNKMPALPLPLPVEGMLGNEDVMAAKLLRCVIKLW